MLRDFYSQGVAFLLFLFFFFLPSFFFPLSFLSQTHTPRSSMSGSNETIKPDDYLPFNPDDSDTADQPSPMVQFYKKRMSSTSTEQARNSVDFNMSLGGSLRTQSSLAKMALAEREGRFINKPLSPMADRFASWQGDSQRLSQSAGGAMLSKKSPEAAARERRFV